MTASWKRSKIDSQDNILINNKIKKKQTSIHLQILGNYILPEQERNRPLSPKKPISILLDLLWMKQDIDDKIKDRNKGQKKFKSKGNSKKILMVATPIAEKNCTGLIEMRDPSAMFDIKSGQDPGNEVQNQKEKGLP